MKKIFLILIIFVVFIVGSVLAASFFVKKEHVVDALNKVVSQKLDSKIRFSDASLSFVPSISLKIKDFQMEQPKRISDKDLFVAAKKAQFSISYIDLLKQARVKVLLAGAEVKVLSRKDVSTFSYLFKKTEKLETKAKSKKEKSNFISNYIEKSELDLSVVDSKVTSVDLNKRFSSTYLVNFLKIPKFSMVDLFSYELSISPKQNSKKEYFIDGDLKIVSTRNLKIDPLRANFKYKKNLVKLKMSYQLKGATKVLSGSLSSEELNLNDFVASSEKNEKKQSSSPGLELQNTLAGIYENKSLRNLFLLLDVDLKSAKYLDADYKNIKSKLKITNQNILLENLNIDGHSGKITVDAKINLSKALASFDLKSKAVGLVVEDLVKSFAPKWSGDVGGVFNGNLNVSTKGLSRDNLDKYLNGSTAFSLDNGFLKIALLREISKKLNSLEASPLSKINSSLNKKLVSLSSKISKVANEKGKFKKLKMRSDLRGSSLNFSNLEIIYSYIEKDLGDIKLVSNKGWVDFDKNLEFEALFLFDPSKVKIKDLIGDSKQVELPVRVKGSVDKPRVDLTFVAKKVIKTKVKSVVKKEVNKQVDKLKKGIGDKLKKLKFSF